jgi:hypothetical protein
MMRESLDLYSSPQCHTVSNACMMYKNAAEQYVCFRGFRLSVLLFDASVLLWSAFAGSQIGD